jgi:hypothetical protein
MAAADRLNLEPLPLTLAQVGDDLLHLLTPSASNKGLQFCVFSRRIWPAESCQAIRFISGSSWST